MLLMLSPNLAQLNRDMFVVDEAETTVRLDEHRGDFDLGDLDLDARDAHAPKEQDKSHRASRTFYWAWRPGGATATTSGKRRGPSSGDP